MRRKIKIKYWIIMLFLGILVFPTAEKEVRGNSELYIAGIPDAFPLQSYDKKSKEYTGILSDILDEAAEEAGLTIRYINPSKRDERLSLAGNTQVDALWDWELSKEDMESAGLAPGADILVMEEEGKRKTAALAYTISMSEETKEKLEAALGDISQERISGLYIKYSASSEEEDGEWIFFHRVLPGLLMIAFIFLMLLPWKLYKKKKQIEQMAYVDDVTGADSFARWKQKYDKCIAGENCRHYAVLHLYAGIEKISHIYGHIEAEEALRLVSESCLPFIDGKTEGLTRFNEFYFAAFIRYTASGTIRERIERMQEAIEKTLEEHKKKYFLDIHTGVYRLTNTERDSVKALQYSEVAMEYARNHFQVYAFYDEFVEKETIAGYAMEHEAIHGLMNREFILYLQPIIALEDGSICGAEALVRWNSPNRGLLLPDQFLDVMNKKQLLGKMNMEIYRQGCRLLRQEKDKGNYLRLLFNFSAANLGDESFVSQLFSVAELYEVETSQIVIQFNQSAEISRKSVMTDTVGILREKGFDVCLGDLELDGVFCDYLACGINGVKLKRDLIGRLDTEAGRKVVASIVNLCGELGLQALCVGVETEEQERYLKDLGCALAMGYYYCHPVDEDNFSGLLGENMKKPLGKIQV